MKISFSSTDANHSPAAVPAPSATDTESGMADNGTASGRAAAADGCGAAPSLSQVVRPVSVPQRADHPAMPAPPHTQPTEMEAITDTDDTTLPQPEQMPGPPSCPGCRQGGIPQTSRPVLFPRHPAVEQPPRRRTRWRTSTLPPCFPSREQWYAWCEMQLYAHASSPCEDCTPQWQRKACQRGRCLRPETVFLLLRDGSLQGWSADNPHYARLLQETPLGDAAVLVPHIERGAHWERLLRRARDYAHPLVAQTIDDWLAQKEDEE